MSVRIVERHSMRRDDYLPRVLEAGNEPNAVVVSWLRYEVATNTTCLRHQNGRLTFVISKFGIYEGGSFDFKLVLTTCTYHRHQ